VAGIASLGWSLPHLAIKADDYRKAAGAFVGRGVTEKTVAPFDEDELTLGIEAAERALAAQPLQATHVRFLAFASVGAPRGSASQAAVALGCDRALAVDFVGAGPPFGAALRAACEFAESSGEAALVVVADALRARLDDPAEHTLGAAGGAFLIMKKGPVQLVGEAWAPLAALDASRVGTDGLVRSPAGDDPSPAALRLALARLFAGGFDAADFDLAAGPERGGPLVALHSPSPLKEGALGPPVFSRTGDVGAASAALALITALEGAEGDDQLLLGDAEGASAAAFALKVGARPRGSEGFRTALAESRTHLTWHAYLGHRRYLPDALPTNTRSEGAYVSPAAWEDALEARLRLIASRCRSCKRVRHPPRDRCPDCGGNDLENFTARPTGTVHAVTRIGRGGAPSEFALQQSLVGDYGVVIAEMADGFRAVAQVSGADPKTVKIGDAVHLRVRRLFEQEGRTRYGLKAVPVGPEHYAGAGARKD
jgi:uncharacterized OB-fold protein